MNKFEDEFWMLRKQDFPQTDTANIETQFSNICSNTIQLMHYMYPWFLGIFLLHCYWDNLDMESQSSTGSCWSDV